MVLVEGAEEDNLFALPFGLLTVTPDEGFDLG
jgi:hypothetical protein